MKNLKKVLSLVLTGLMLVGSMALTACNSDEGYNIPIVCGEGGMNDLAGVATYGVDYYNLGVKAGDMAADILLKGADPATMAVATDPNPALSVNETVAGEIGFTIPDSVKSRAGGSATMNVTRAESWVYSGVTSVSGDQSNVGFQDQLSVRMAEAGKTVAFLNENAAGDQSNNTTIAETFVSKNVSLIYTIATSSSQAAAAATTSIPVVFNAVTDPVDAGLVKAMDAPGGNVTGVSDINPVADQIDLIAELLGKTDVKIGLLYTSAETNSVFQINMAKAQCEAKGYSFVDKGIGDINDIQAAFTALKAEGVDAIYIPTDNVLANGCPTIHALNIGE